MSEWVLPPALKRALSRTIAGARPDDLSYGQKALLAANARLQGAYTGRRCFVLGNGPSLARVDISSFGDEITVVMNAFNQHPAMHLWQPVIHCVAEPANSYSTPDRVRFLEGMLSGYTSTDHVFPIEMKDLFDRTGLLPPEKLLYVTQDGRKAAEFRRIDLTGPIPVPHDTSILAVSVAIAMGCDPIVLLGVDYNWLSHRSANTHFYDDSAMAWPVEDMAATPYLDAMRQSIGSWEAHAALRRIAAGSGQTILNATEGSFLDAYPMIDLSAVLAERDISHDRPSATFGGNVARS
jgi:hypothetical protein